MESGSQQASSELNRVDDTVSDERFAQITASHKSQRTVYPCIDSAASLLGVAFNNLRWSHVSCWAEEAD